MLVSSLDAKTQSQDIVWNSIAAKNEKEIEKIITERAEIVRQLLAPEVDPYKGEDSVPQDCRASSFPVPKKWKDGKSEGIMYSFYSSQGRVLGACPARDERLKTQFIVLRCASQLNVQIIRYFYSPKKPWQLEPVVRCL